MDAELALAVERVIRALNRPAADLRREAAAWRRAFDRCGLESARLKSELLAVAADYAEEQGR
jgi:hypothetical protein